MNYNEILKESRERKAVENPSVSQMEPEGGDGGERITRKGKLST